MYKGAISSENKERGYSNTTGEQYKDYDNEMTS